MKIGAGTILKDFDDQLVGMEKAAGKEFKIRFPEDYFNKELANKEIDFKVTLKDIQKEVLPEINDQMAKDLGPFDSLEALRAEIRKNLKEGYEKRVEQELNEQIFTALIAQTDFESPEVMIQYELDGILSDAERAFEASNLTMEQVGQTREKLSAKYRDVAEKQVRRHLILDAIIGQEKLTISDEELENGFKEMAASFNQPVDVIKAFYQQNPDKVEYFKHTLLEKKAIKLILDNSNITEVEPESEAETQADQSSEAESES
jgi:trigger factor